MKKIHLLTGLIVCVLAIQLTQAQTAGKYYYAFRIDGDTSYITEVAVFDEAKITKVRGSLKANDELYNPRKPAAIIGPMSEEEAKKAQTRRKWTIVNELYGGSKKKMITVTFDELFKESLGN